uniref:Uncharacterized protein n=1 Tax=Anguilla anguilla TaxID=7936 RepID=A0A0E9U2J9_ANGAN
MLQTVESYCHNKSMDNAPDGHSPPCFTSFPLLLLSCSPLSLVLLFSC